MKIIDELNLNPLQRSAIDIIRSSLADGLSGNKILNTLKGTPAAMRKQTFYQVVRHLKKINKKQNYIKSVRYDFNLNPDRIPTGDKEYKANFNYLLSFDGIDLNTGERVNKHVTVTSAHLLTKNEAEGVARETIEWEDAYKIEIIGRGTVMEIFKGSFNPGI